MCFLKLLFLLPTQSRRNNFVLQLWNGFWLDSEYKYIWSRFYYYSNSSAKPLVCCCHRHTKFLRDILWSKREYQPNISWEYSALLKWHGKHHESRILQGSMDHCCTTTLPNTAKLLWLWDACYIVCFLHLNGTATNVSRSWHANLSSSHLQWYS